MGNTTLSNVTGVNTVACEVATAVGPSSDTAPLLPDPLEAMAASGDLIAQIAALLVQSGRKDRDQATRLSEMEERQIAASGAARVAQMREQAHDIRVEGWVAGLSGVAAGAAGVVGSVGFKVPKEGERPIGQALCKAGDCQDSMGKIAAGSAQAAQQDHQAAAEEHKTAADAATKRQERYADEARNAREFLAKVSEFLRDASSARQGAKSAAIIRA